MKMLTLSFQNLKIMFWRDDIMSNEKGSISINTENIFPIIKKWLYSDKDIFIRELISNGCDAVSKHKRLVSFGEAEGSGRRRL